MSEVFLKKNVPFGSMKHKKSKNKTRKWKSGKTVFSALNCPWRPGQLFDAKKGVTKPCRLAVQGTGGTRDQYTS